MAGKLFFEITTPERIVFQEEADQVSVPTSTGEITILPEHIALVSELVPGELTLLHNGEPQHFVVAGGFVEVRDGNRVIILADLAERAEEIDVVRAEEARERARKLMSEERQDSEGFAEASALLEKSLARLRVANRARHRGRRRIGIEGVLPE